MLVITANRPAEVQEPIERMSVHAEILTLDASVGPLQRSITAARETRRALHRHDHDLVFLDCFETLGAPATFVAQRNDIPVIARLVDNPWRKLEEEFLVPAWQERNRRKYVRHRISDGLNRYIYRQAAGFVAVSTELITAIEANTGCPRERIGVVPVPVTTDTRTEGSERNARGTFDISEEQVVLTVTNFNFRAKRQGTETVVSELRGLLGKRDDLAYVIAGGGAHLEQFRNWLDKRIEDPAVRRRIYVLGFVDAVADLYQLADVFAYVSSLDGYPNVILEAQTAELPVVANDAHGMRDQITDGETGRLIDPTDAGMLRKRVTALIEDERERRRLGTNARKRVMEENTPTAVAQRLSAELDRLFDEIGQ
jgi:glycosyltransferase involved in cell wall biosynthesis